ncbi:hypothetical protein K469DRAFT_725727 [Zopfia rhizophila CBS 207.26]|uniref:Endonuclease/exonuclease/phosphatase domain-containing protein n=1 Tax=Zopfia rhizophila CBS 207.26 TaxID=1314779 RepID=A0A6A6E8P3_9PEZI|nr:hypothetical protein K469DRAFT_725727 [Zopfia rhizophila CBS 207.26]
MNLQNGLEISARKPRLHPIHTIPSLTEPGARPKSDSSPSTAETLKDVQLITWNIDFMAPFPRARMSAALTHLEAVISTIPATSAVIIHLQEMMEAPIPSTDPHQSPNDLHQLSKAPWVRERFYVTDLTSENWAAAYGTVTLVDKRLQVKSVSRLHFVGEFGRDALMVDLALQGTGKVLRLCNLHLDSSSGMLRPIQWKGVKNYLQNDTVATGILAGDTNANRPRDKTEPEENRFKDAYLELGGNEGDEEGATWGFQSTDWERWGKIRLDKVVFCGDVEMRSLERVGVGVRVDNKVAKKGLREAGGLDFATDHFGLRAELVLKIGLSMVGTENEKMNVHGEC